MFVYKLMVALALLLNMMWSVSFEKPACIKWRQSLQI